MDSLILGRYIPGDSIIHRMDPRSKFLNLFIFVCMIFWLTNPITHFIAVLYILLCVYLTKVPMSYFIKGIKPMIFFIAFTTLFQLFFVKGGHLYYSWGLITISQTGIEQAAIVFFRFLFIIVYSTILTLTTTPIQLADAIESLLKPFKKIGLPAHEIGLMLSMSLRFVPTLMDDTTRIMNAQRARGVDFDEGNIFKKLKSMVPILIPLFASSFKRADALAIAMESRGYQGDRNRTKYRNLTWTQLDTMNIVILLILSISIYLLKS